MGLCGQIEKGLGKHWTNTSDLPPECSIFDQAVVPSMSLPSSFQYPCLNALLPGTFGQIALHLELAELRFIVGILKISLQLPRTLASHLHQIPSDSELLTP